MRRSRLLLGLVPAVPTLIAVASCSSPEAAQLDLVMRAPQGALGSAKSVKLSVFDAAKGTCDAATGNVPAIPTDADGTLSFDLQSTGCPAGVAWCKDITLDKDDSTKIFAIVARDEGGVLAEGCTTQKINQDPLSVQIKVHLTNVEKCCSDGTIQPGEQCEGTPLAGQCGGIAETDVCDPSCQSKAIQLANDSATPPLTEGGKAKSEVAMAFCSGKGELLDALRVVYTSASSDTTGMSDINLRALSKDLLPIKDPFTYSHQVRIPILCTEPGGAGSIREQRSPAIARVTDIRNAVVYASNEGSGTQYEIFLSAQSHDGCAEKGPLKISKQTPPGEDAGRPDVSEGPAGLALAVWPRGGQARGRIWKPPADGIGPGELMPMDLDTEIDLAPSALDVTEVRVAGWSGGWVIVYAGKGTGDDDGVFMNTVFKDGNLGTAQRVNAATMGLQDQADVAVLKSGARMVTWRSEGDIYFQLYDALEKVIGDQLEPIHPKDAVVQQHPAVAAGGIGEFYVAVWEDGADDIKARFVDGDADGGFLQNSVTGQNDFFSATPLGSKGLRRQPAVTVGGYVVIGWHDESTDAPGVFVRRFPLPK